MKKVLILSALLLLSSLAFAQQAATTKLYFYCAPGNLLTTTLNPDSPIKISRCTLVETNADSLGIPVSKTKTVYLHFERGKTYYYQVIGGATAYSAISRVTSENEFWLNIAFNRAGTYRHYVLDKTLGLKQLDDPE